jgi:hypothetical protein
MYLTTKVASNVPGVLYETLTLGLIDVAGDPPLNVQFVVNTLKEVLVKSTDCPKSILVFEALASVLPLSYNTTSLSTSLSQESKKKVKNKIK